MGGEKCGAFGIGGINGENDGLGPGRGGGNLGGLMPGGGGRILGNIPGCRSGIPRGLNMSGGGGARRPINGGGFIAIPLPLPRPRARPIRLSPRENPPTLLPQYGSNFFP